MVGVLLYAWITPGTQLFPPKWDLEARQNWKPTPLFWITMGVFGMYLLMENMPVMFRR